MDPTPRETEVDGAYILVTPAWTPPEHRILPEVIEQGRRYLEHMLKPSGAEGVGQALMPLLITQEIPKTEGMEEKTIDAFYNSVLGEYARHLKHVPLDILKTACDAHVTTGSKFFPSVFEIASVANPLHERRKVELERLYAVQRNAGKKTIAHKAFEKEPEHVRLLTLLKQYERPGSMLYNAAKARDTRKRLQELVDAERDLANDQGRSPAAWTIVNEDVGFAPSIETPSDWRDAGLDDLLAPKVPRGAKTNTEKRITDVVEEPPPPSDPMADALVAEEDCPGHVASKADPMVCGRCGIHVNSLRPDEPDAQPDEIPT